MFYFNSRYLSDKLEINLAKWKRWAREFLPPDPLGGLQSGYARHFNLKDAFRVYLGGQLVGGLQNSIPDTKRILAKLDAHLEPMGYYQLTPNENLLGKEHSWVCIYNTFQNELVIMVETETDIRPPPNARLARMVSLGIIYKEFIQKIGTVSTGSEISQMS